MIYKSSNTGKLFEIESEKKQTQCPECSEYRKKKDDKCLKWYSDGGYCHHCETSFYKYEEKQKEYIYPEWKNKTDLTDKAVKWFEGRGISQSVLKELKVYSDIEYMPQLDSESEVICFPFFDGETLVNIKYRGVNKSFKLHKDSKRIFFNQNAISKDVVIVEGEIDVLSFYVAGVKNVISVPNGANRNLDYLDESISLFEKADTIYLATDNDLKGLELRDELARRLGIDKCKIVNFKDCKDANEYLIKYGGFELNEAVKQAKYYPIKGIIKASDIYGDIVDLFNNGVQPGMKIGVPFVDQCITWETRRLAIVTGIPSHGKSEFVDYIISRLNVLHGWKAAYFTPENYPLKFHYAKMFEKYIGSKFKRSESEEIEFDIAFEHINSNIFYIMDEDDFTADTILSAAVNLVKSRGIKILVIDPYNKLDHRQERGETETLYISKFLDKLTVFAKMHDVLVFLIAHPTKMKKEGNVFEIPTLYHISGSAHFYNKCDYGFCIYRTIDINSNKLNDHIQIHWQKIKFRHLGEGGISYLDYNINNGRFDVAGGVDNTNWLINGIEKEQTEAPF